MGDVVSSINWGQPNFVAAAVSALFFVFLSYLFLKKGSKSKKALNNSAIFIAVLSGSGFLITGWLGLLTLSLALSLIISQRVKKGKFYTSISVTIVTFLLLSTIVVRVDPQASGEKRAGVGGGIWGGAVDFITNVGENAPKIVAVVALVALVFFFVNFYLARRRRNLYKSLGVDSRQMYNNIVNREMKPIPEGERDPRRVFPKKMRDDKLTEQKGLCLYSYLPAHPRWEPYREGIQWEGDHIIPWAVGGATTYVNLQMLCADCNSAKSSKMLKEAELSVNKMWEEKRARAKARRERRARRNKGL